nr:autotransporter outer membrane beta-barrel domain-containing protein [uncultured Pseudomonas sp.]
MNRKGIHSVPFVVNALSVVVMANALSLMSATTVNAGALSGPGVDITVEPGDIPESWTVANSAELTLDPGAQATTITLFSLGTVNINSATTSTILAQDGFVNISAGSSVVSTNNAGLTLASNFGEDSESIAIVEDSSISGFRLGVFQASGSQLTLTGSSVYGRDNGANGLVDGGVGVGNRGGTLTASNSTITGDRHGIVIFADGRSAATAPTADITLDNTSVQGLTGTAIVVGTLAAADPLITANIAVTNNSTVSGGNGNVLEVKDGNTANVTVDASHLTGNTIIDATSFANLALQNSSSLTGQLTNVTSMAVDGSSVWNMTDNSTVGALNMNGGEVHFAQATGYRQLTVESLNGTGTYFMNVNFPGANGDLLKVNGQAEGDHSLVVKNTGLEPVKGDGDVVVVETGGGSADFKLRDGVMDYGTFQYELQKQGNDWALVQVADDDGTPVITPGTKTVLGLFSAAPTVWYGELATLRTRMGELRMGDAGSGGWARAYGNKFDVDQSSGVAYQQNQQGLSFGADGKLNTSEGEWLLGVLGGYSKSDLSLSAGSSGRINSYYVGAYTTWLSPSGYYVDAVVKLNRLDNKADVRMSDGEKAKGDYSNLGLGGSVEVGKHIKFAEQWFVEPYAQLSALAVSGKDFNLNNGMRADGRSADSVLGKIGTTVGRNFDFVDGAKIQPYVKVAAAHEFSKGNKVTVNDTRFTNDFSGTRGELGLGLAVQVRDNLQFHVDTDYSSGEKIDQPWGVSAGVRFVF